MDKRRIGNSGLEVAPLALGGNVFGWTADEATSFAIARRVRRCRRDDDRHRRRLFGLGAGPFGRRERGGDRPLAEARAGKRDKVVIATKVGFMAGLAPETIAARLRRLAAAARGRARSTFITSIRTMRACRWPTAWGRSMHFASGQDPRDRPQQFHRAAGRGSAASQRRRRRLRTGRARCRIGTIWSSAKSSRARCAMSRRPRAWRSFPYYASPTAS